jgi:excisionase family DNA binding protein
MTSFMSPSEAEAARQASFHWAPPPVAVERWMTVDDVCVATQLAERTVRQYVTDGKLRGYRVGGSHHLRFKQVDVDAIMVPVDPKGVE